ncbi:1909_t:CDS:2 [Scutellospora calospora]|uniref:1909_t:CDS:1 n=1 Tax=Scutellospora calospora TaxID=85575 RepID=A0ACA9KHD3_9GLOM|nr:1909_t:CDS:2 [Scutellospora calospora]
MKSKQEKRSSSDELSQKTEYQKYLAELEDPNYQGGSWALPENATPLEQAKHDICKKVVSYKLDTKISTEELAQKSKVKMIVESKTIKVSMPELFRLIDENFSEKANETQ